MNINIVAGIDRGWDWSYSRMAIAIQQRLKYNIEISNCPLPSFFDIVHFIPGDQALISSLQNLNSKKVAFLGNFYEWNNKLRGVLGNIDIGVFQQEQLRNDVVKQGIDESMLRVIRPGIDLDKFKVIIKVGIVGHVRVAQNRNKGGVDLIQLFMRAKWENFKFVFAGKDWDKEFGNAYRDSGVNVEFLGNVPYKDMPSFYNTIDYLLIASKIDSGPLVLAEALACGKPVISTKVGWAPEFDVTHYETIDGLADILWDIEKDFLTRRAQVENLTWDNWAEKHGEIYRGLCANL